MNPSTGYSDYQEFVEKILASKAFGRSKTYENLLIYLVQCTLSGNIPKETTIAEETFAKEKFDPTQSTLIRVYMYNLRKKLKTYYQNEGAKDPVVLQIPKGSYAVKFVKPKTERSRWSALRSSPWISAPGLFLVISLGFHLYGWIGQKKEALVTKDGLWKDLLSSPRPTWVVLGDLFVYAEYDTSTKDERYIRDPEINSKAEFEIFKTTYQNPSIELEELTYTYLIRSSTIWIKSLTEIFFSIDKDYSIKNMSRFNPKDLGDNDMIVIGMMKNLGLFNAYFNHSIFDFNNPNEIIANNGPNNQMVFSPTGDPDSYHVDYGFMAKFPGPSNNTIYYFGGLWDTGVSQSIKSFTHPKLREELEMEMRKKFGHLPKYYEVLFEVSGVDRMELSTKTIYINQIQTSSKIWEVNKPQE